MLSDREQRALEEIERCLVTEAQELVPPGRATRRHARRPNRPPGFRVVLVLGCLSVALVFASVPVAALALALATAIGWSFWRLCSYPKDVDIAVRDWISGRTGQLSSGSRPGASIRQYLKWLAEAE